MRKKERLIKIILLCVIVVLSIGIVTIPNVYATVSNGKNSVQLFKDDLGLLNDRTHPTHIYADSGVYLFCTEHGRSVTKYMTATQALYNQAINQNKRNGTGLYNENDPYYTYSRSDSMGLIQNHRGIYNSFVSSIGGNCGEHRSVSAYDGDDGATIAGLESNTMGLPGFSQIVYSLQYDKIAEHDASQFPGAAYILTAQKVYSDAKSTPKDAAHEANLTDLEKELGYFNIDEKQFALWNKQIGLNIGKAPEANLDDRNLAAIALKYQEFYQTLKANKGEDTTKTGYEDVVKALPVEGYSDEIKETKTTIEGKELKTYQYQHANIGIDTKAQSYVIGPFCIDYTVDDENLDTYTSFTNPATGVPNQIKYNSIEKITVYNQNKVDIEKLGGNFKIAYTYNGKITPENEGKVRRISDQYYYEAADYQEISGFDSRKPFYIVVYRGSMRAEDFTGFYAKIDFQYLRDIKATTYDYEGSVYKYHYIKSMNQNYHITYSGSWCNKSWDKGDWDDEKGKYTGGHWDHDSHSKSASYAIWTNTYTLRRAKVDLKGQKMTGYTYDGWRYYDSYSIVLKTDWDEKEEPRIELAKKCADDGKALYGARYDVTLEIKGENIQKHKIDKTVKLTRTTDVNGILSITTSDLESHGVYLGTFTGTIHVNFKETKAPANHVLGTGDASMTVHIDRGIITSGGDVDHSRNSARVTATNRHGGTPAIQLAKVNKQGNLLEEAYFKIHVSYTDPNGVKFGSDGHIETFGKLIDRNSVIQGGTSGGYLNLTREDFLHMDYGFDITNYSGKITLKITEVAITANGYSISSNGLNITLTYEYGKLTEYFEDSDASVKVHYLYDNPFANIQAWIKGEGTLFPYVREKVETWAREEAARTEKTYDDVLAWLAKYIEDNELDHGSKLEEWKDSTLSTNLQSNTGTDIIQIVIEDEPGDFTLPNIPDEPPPSPFLMKIGGKAFLDETPDKGSIVSDGKLGLGEEALFGVEVTLYEENGAKANLVHVDGSSRNTNPTITDEKGQYLFTGVDPLKKYYVEFRYNGIEYKVTDSIEAEYNSKEWEVTSKAGETDTSARANHAIVTRENPAYDYDYDGMRGIYEEIANYTWNFINNNHSYPSWENDIKPYMMAKHPSDQEMANKLNYMKSAQVVAIAGYSSSNTSGRYPHKDMGELFIIDDEVMNSDEETIDFAGEKIPKVYAGQVQVHIGLVRRAATDLRLKLDVLDTTVSMNRYDTVYKYGEGDSAYHQYIYEEDYNYETSFREDGTAYYTTTADGTTFFTEDFVHFYVTYQATITNASLTQTAMLEMIDYYNDKLTWKESYQTTKGKEIPGFKAWFNTTDITANGTVKDGKTVQTEDANYKSKLVSFSTPYNIVEGNTLTIRLTYELTDTADNAKAILDARLRPEDISDRLSKSWDIANYAEITKYATPEGNTDTNSLPGNFDLKVFEAARKEYQRAYQNWLDGGKTEELNLLLKLAETRMEKLMENDTKRVGLTLTNHDGRRTITGNVWEAVNDTVKSSLDLQSEYGDRYVEWSDNKELALEGIRVELVELLKGEDNENGANQIVRATTTTKADGSYSFNSFIAGDYTVRFVYGDYAKGEDQTIEIYSKVTKNTKQDQENADFLPITGQYYQSTKANPQTDTETYWYSHKQYREDLTDSQDLNKGRYSDAYDDAFSRLTQMNSKVENTENSTSTIYDYDANIEVQTTRHTDPIYAYTSTMELEIEYIRPEILGTITSTEADPTKSDRYYEYQVNGVDFGLTPRAYNDVNVERYISNIKLYTEKGADPIINVNFDKNGMLLDRENAVGSKYVSDTDENAIVSYKDGVVRVNYEQVVSQGAHLEISYTIDVVNNSLFDAENSVYDTIKYIYGEEGKVIAIAYYNEELGKLVSYETVNAEGFITYHNNLAHSDYTKGLARDYRNQDNRIPMANTRLMSYNRIHVTEENVGTRETITAKAKNIVDYPGEVFDFTNKNYADGEINKFWVDTKPEEFVSSRENYKIENGEISLLGTPGAENSLVTASHIVRATDDSPLYQEIKPGETVTDILVLQDTLSSTVDDVTGDPFETDLSGNDREYTNLVEITRLENSAGKIVDTEGYDITGKEIAETSEVQNISDLATGVWPDTDIRISTFGIEEVETELTPTLSTGKPPTTVVAPPAGLSSEDNWQTYTGIALVSLVILSGGIILIKKYALVKKQAE